MIKRIYDFILLFLNILNSIFSFKIIFLFLLFHLIFKIIQYDQTIINGVCSHKIGLLPAKYGVLIRDLSKYYWKVLNIYIKKRNIDILMKN